MKRLRDYPLVADLERDAILNPELRARGAGWGNEDVDAMCRALFGVTTREVYEATLEDGADEEDEDHPCYDILGLPQHDQVAALEGFGWDARDEYGRPLLVLHHLLWPLLWAIAGDHGAKEPGPPGADPEDWGASLEAEVLRFRPSAGRR